MFIVRIATFYRIHRKGDAVRVRKNLRLLKAGEDRAFVPKETPRPEIPGEELLWMTAPTDENAAAGIIEYTWTPSKPLEPAARPKVRRRN